MNIVHLIDNMEFMATCKDNQFDLAIADPPYGIGEDGKKNHSRGKLAVATKYIQKEWDKETPAQEYFNELKRISKNQIIWGGNYFIDKIKTPTMGWIFWDKQMSSDFSDGELAYTSFNKALRRYTFTWNGMMQGDMKHKEHRIHPTQKPVALYKWLLQNYAKPGQAIFDSHVGSGSIRIACYDMGFDFVGCEIDEDYWMAQEERFKNHTDQIDLFSGKELQEGIFKC